MTDEEKQAHEEDARDAAEAREDEEREKDLEYARTASLTELRRLWRWNQKEAHRLFLGHDWHIWRGHIEYRDRVLILEFEQRGFIVTGQGGVILREPARQLWGPCEFCGELFDAAHASTGREGGCLACHRARYAA